MTGIAGSRDYVGNLQSPPWRTQRRSTHPTMHQSPPRSLQVPYVIPRPGVPSHMYGKHLNNNHYPIFHVIFCMFQLIVYTDPVIQNNLPIFISQLRALYPNDSEVQLIMLFAVMWIRIRIYLGPWIRIQRYKMKGKADFFYFFFLFLFICIFFSQ